MKWIKLYTIDHNEIWMREEDITEICFMDGKIVVEGKTQNWISKDCEPELREWLAKQIV